MGSASLIRYWSLLWGSTVGYPSDSLASCWLCNAPLSLFLICKRRTINYFDDDDNDDYSNRAVTSVFCLPHAYSERKTYTLSESIFVCCSCDNDICLHDSRNAARAEDTESKWLHQEITGTQDSRVSVIKDKQGKWPTDYQVKARWAEYFRVSHRPYGVVRTTKEPGPGIKALLCRCCRNKLKKMPSQSWRVNKSPGANMITAAEHQGNKMLTFHMNCAERSGKQRKFLMEGSSHAVTVAVFKNKKAMLSQGNRAMPL